jgi:hypothetical protein
VYNHRHKQRGRVYGRRAYTPCTAAGGGGADLAAGEPSSPVAAGAGGGGEGASPFGGGRGEERVRAAFSDALIARPVMGWAFVVQFRYFSYWAGRPSCCVSSILQGNSPDSPDGTRRRRTASPDSSSSPPSRRRGDPRSWRSPLPDGPASQRTREFISVCDDAQSQRSPCCFARPARGGCCADSVSRELFLARVRREQGRLPRCSPGSPGLDRGSCARLGPRRELVRVFTDPLSPFYYWNTGYCSSMGWKLLNFCPVLWIGRMLIL